MSTWVFVGTDLTTRDVDPIQEWDGSVDEGIWANARNVAINDTVYYWQTGHSGGVCGVGVVGQLPGPARRSRGQRTYPLDVQRFRHVWVPRSVVERFRSLSGFLSTVSNRGRNLRAVTTAAGSALQKLVATKEAAMGHGGADANDLAAPPKRIMSSVMRSIRDTAMVRALKKLHKNRCQLCGRTVRFDDGREYSEGHHLQPLGKPHDGPDVAANILILCPNCHAKCDMAGIRISTPRLADGHQVGSKYVDYHNALVDGLKVPPQTRRGR
jgi:hypothetical protein